jgi:hypothetical protein
MESKMSEQSMTQQAAALCDLLLAFEAQKKTLAEDKRRLDEATAKAIFDLSRLMLENNLTVIGSDRAVATLTTAIVPKVTDWGMLYEHIRESGDFDLLYRRVTATAYDERRKLGVSIPGIEPVEVSSVKVKAKARP